MGAILKPFDDGAQIPIDKAVVLIGRHPDCDFVLTTSRKVSRKHCCVVQVNDQFVVRDLGSMNGLRVNGQGVARESPLNPGDELAIGNVRFRFEVVPNGDQPAAMFVGTPGRKKPRHPTPVTSVNPVALQRPRDSSPNDAPAPVVTPQTPEDLSQDYPVVIRGEAAEQDFFELADAVDAGPLAESVDYMPIGEKSDPLFEGDIDDVILLDDDDD